MKDIHEIEKLAREYIVSCVQKRFYKANIEKLDAWVSDIQSR